MAQQVEGEQLLRYSRTVVDLLVILIKHEWAADTEARVVARVEFHRFIFWTDGHSPLSISMRDSAQFTAPSDLIHHHRLSFVGAALLV